MFLNDSQVRRRQEIGTAALARHAELGEDVLGRYIELRDPARVLMPGSVRVAEGGARVVSGGSTVTVPADKYRIVETDDADLVATIKAPGWMFGNGERPDDAAEIKLEFVPVRVVGSDGRGCELSVEMLASAYAMEDAKTEKEKYEALSLYYQFEDGERVLDPDEVADMMLRGSAPVATDETGDADVQTVVLARVKTDSEFVNHSLIAKAIEGLQPIAFGESSFETSPKKGSKSKEHYKVTASSDACVNFFYNCGGNVEQLKDVAETVFNMRTNKSAQGFVYKGRIWFTVNSIVEEMRRTTAGTVEANKYENDRRLVDAALLALSGTQIVGTDPKGDPINVGYVVNAMRLEKVTYRGKTYFDVWGFAPDVWTLNDYAKEIGQAHSYPLLQSDKPMTIDEAWIDRYLKDVLNEARGRLYTKGKNGKIEKRKGVTSVKVKRLWDAIFEKASPLNPLDGRGKRRVVAAFEKMLKKQADMEVHGEMREGMPMSIEAHSERNPSRGRGKGAWEKLVITCLSETEVPKVDLFGESDGQEKSNPEKCI